MTVLTDRHFVLSTGEPEIALFFVETCHGGRAFVPLYFFIHTLHMTGRGFRPAEASETVPEGKQG